MTKTILITGASSGIGQQCVKACLANGFEVIGLARDFKKSKISDNYYSTYQCDLSKATELEKILKTIIKEHHPNYFLHCAGYGRFGSLDQFSFAQIQHQIQVNLISAILICRLLLPEFRKAKQGKMIFIGSESALKAGKKGAVYCASKFGLRGFTQALREDCAADNVAITLINPGMVDSAFFDDLNFRPAEGENYSLSVQEMAKSVIYTLQSPANMVIEEINLAPAIKNIDFSKKPDNLQLQKK